jgi:hypothetical protein
MNNNIAIVKELINNDFIVVDLVGKNLKTAQQLGFNFRIK